MVNLNGGDGIRSTPASNTQVTGIRGLSRSAAIGPNLLSALAESLGDGAILKGIITSAPRNGQAIFTTDKGSFILNDAESLNIGDKIAIRINKDKGGDLSAKLVQVNNTHLGDDLSAIDLANSKKSGIRLDQSNYSSRNNYTQQAVQIDENIRVAMPGLVAEGKVIAQSTAKMNQLLQNILNHNVEAEQDTFGQVSALTLQENQDNILNKATNEENIKRLKSITLGSIVKFKVIAQGGKDNSTLENGLTKAEGREGTKNFTFNAKLINIDKFGNHTLQTDFGDMSIDSKIHFQPGVNYEIEIISSKVDEIIDAAISDIYNHAKNFYGKINNQWDNFEKLFSLIQHLDFKNSDNHMMGVLPATNNKMLAHILKFAEAVENGNIEDIVGPEVIAKVKDLGLESLIKELKEDFIELKRMHQSDISQDKSNWQSLLVPIFDGQQMNYARIFSRRNEDIEGQVKFVRFVIEIETEIYGQLQLDGLVTISLEDQKVKDFDLTCRTKASPNENLVGAIQTIFEHNKDISKITGAIRFDQAEQFPVNPLKDIKQDRFEGSGNSSILI